MRLEPVGDMAAIEAVLQLTHAVVVEGGTRDRVGQEGLGSVAHGTLWRSILGQETAVMLAVPHQAVLDA